LEEELVIPVDIYLKAHWGKSKNDTNTWYLRYTCVHDVTQAQNARTPKSKNASEHLQFWRFRRFWRFDVLRWQLPWDSPRAWHGDKISCWDSYRHCHRGRQSESFTHVTHSVKYSFSHVQKETQQFEFRFRWAEICWFELNSLYSARFKDAGGKKNHDCYLNSFLALIFYGSKR